MTRRALRFLTAPGRPVTPWVVAADVLLALALLAVTLWLAGVDAETTPDRVRWDAAALTAPLVAAAVAVHLPLVWRQRRPLAVLCAVFVGEAVGFELLELPAGLAVLVALSAVAAWLPLRRSLAALALVWGITVTLNAVQGDLAAGAAALARDLLVWVLILGLPWGVGAAFRWRRLRGEQRALERERTRRERAQRVVVAERARMARELHDILAHSLSVMVLQASGGREVLPFDRDRAGSALAQIESTGRQSLVEVRRLLGLLEDGGVLESREGRPGLDRLDELVAQLVDAGVAVEVAVVGEARPLPPSVDLAAYRIVQEALTNIVKHAGPASATIRLDYGGALALEVCDDGVGPPPAAATEGKGLLGMRERARLVGGTLEAGPTSAGGFRVGATLPLRAGELMVAEGPGR